MTAKSVIDRVEELLREMVNRGQQGSDLSAREVHLFASALLVCVNEWQATVEERLGALQLLNSGEVLDEAGLDAFEAARERIRAGARVTKHRFNLDQQTDEHKPPRKICGAPAPMPIDATGEPVLCTREPHGDGWHNDGTPYPFTFSWKDPEPPVPSSDPGPSRYDAEPTESEE